MTGHTSDSTTSTGSSDWVFPLRPRSRVVAPGYVRRSNVDVTVAGSGEDLRASAYSRVTAYHWMFGGEPVRPADFVVLGYPVVSMTEAWTHQGSKTNLLGDAADAALQKKLSGEQAVRNDTPPTFIFHTNEDRTVPAENSVYYFLALRKAGVPVEMHIFEKGPHGVGLANENPALSEWSKLLANWLRERGAIK